LPGTEIRESAESAAQAIADYEALQKRVAAVAAAGTGSCDRARTVVARPDRRQSSAAPALETDKRRPESKDDYRVAQLSRTPRATNNIRPPAGAQAAAIAQQFRHRDASGQIVALTAEEVRLRGILLDQNDAIARAKQIELEADREAAQIAQRAAILQGSDSVYDRTQGRLIAIEQERQAEIKKTGDILAANEAAEQKKRALYGETAKQASDDAKTIFDVFRNSSNSTLKAIGTFGENLRRVVIGAEAARALVNAATESAAAIASLAVGDFRGAALHGEAALSYGAAAALGARESLGGGGSGGGASGGGGGDGGGGSTFTPNQQPAGGTTVINLITTDPYGRESINRVSWQLQRNGTLNVPIYPTSGVAMVPG
jgi:hypothetical protein